MDIKFKSIETKPKGGRYSVIYKDNIVMIRSNISTNGSALKPCKFRLEKAKLNKFLEPQQLEFFEKTLYLRSNKLCLVLVVRSHKSQVDNSSIPAFIGIGIPSSDYSHYLCLFAIKDILAFCHDKETYAQAIRKGSVKVEDKVFPVLRKRK